MAPPGPLPAARWLNHRSAAIHLLDGSSSLLVTTHADVRMWGVRMWGVRMCGCADVGGAPRWHPDKFEAKYGTRLSRETHPGKAAPHRDA
eukprot:2093547-Pyramimonas_sp.AAC.1